MFLIHPIELVSEIPDPSKWGRRSGNQFEYLFKEKFRTALKRRNLGERATHLLEGELAFFKSNHYQGKRLVDVYNEINKELVNE